LQAEQVNACHQVQVANQEKLREIAMGIKVFLGLLVGLMLPMSAMAQSAGELLSDAISTSATLNQNLSIERRLDARRKVFTAINQLIERYPGSPEAIKIVSRQIIGSFDYAQEQKRYFKDLNSYQKTTCIAAPSLECLAFVSLDEGEKQCSKPGYAAQEQAHSDILNAIKIFAQQGSDELYVELAVNAYRSCSFGRSQAVRDAYLARLVPELLLLDRSDSARAIVQQIAQPYWKFEAVLAQLASSDVSEATVNRLEKYLDEKLAENPWDFWLASLRLHTFAVEHLGQPFRRSLHRNKATLGVIPTGTVCDEEWRRLHFQTATKTIDTVVHSLELGQYDKDTRLVDNALDGLHLRSIANSLGGCSSSRAFGEGVTLYAYLRLMGSSFARDFLADAITSDFDASVMQEAAFRAYKSDPDLFLEKSHAVDTPPFDKFYGFKISVFEGDMCGAVKTMFEQFVDTPRYPMAVSYLLRSGELDLEADYDCGDAGLEMLLN
jgi:hypothetical protein